MSNAEIRTRILDDHSMLRGRLDRIEALANRFETGGSEVGKELREEGLALFEVFAAHLAYEDAQLVPALRMLPEKGGELATRLEREHREQRELLHYLVGRLATENRPTTLVARELQAFSSYLRIDMSHEESTILEGGILDDAS